MIAPAEDSEDSSRLPFALHFLPTFLAYHPHLASFLEKTFKVIRWEEDKFGNEMPQVVVGEADHLVMLSLINGDSWVKALADIFLASYFKQEGKGGVNVGTLGSLEIFYDQRMDRRGLKHFFYEKVLKIFVVKGQGSFTLAMAKLMKHVVDVDYRVKIDGHSSLDTFQSEKEGVKVINVTVAFEMLDDLTERGFLDDELENVIAGIDLGNLPLVKAIKDKYNWDFAVLHKKRIPAEDGVSSTVKSELVYGDVEGKRVILVDDMISSGSTLIETAREVIGKGAEEVIICATHPVLVGDYYKNLQRLLKNEKVIKVVMTTNLIPQQRPFLGSRPIRKSQPYATTTNKQGQETKRKLEIFDAFTFVGLVVQALANSGGEVDKIRSSLKGHMVRPADKLDLYRDLTGQEFPAEEIVGTYHEGGRCVFFDQK